MEHEFQRLRAVGLGCCLLVLLLPVSVLGQAFTGPLVAVSSAFQAGQTGGGSNSNGGVSLDASGNQFYAMYTTATSFTWGSATRTDTGNRVSVWKLNPSGGFILGLLPLFDPLTLALNRHHNSERYCERRCEPERVCQ
jgi:hypothetical protein